MRLVAGMRALGGDVAVPDDPSLSLQAGMAPAAVPGAVYDVMRATNRAGIASYRHSAAAAVKDRQFSAIISSGDGRALYGPPQSHSSTTRSACSRCPRARPRCSSRSREAASQAPPWSGSRAAVPASAPSAS